MKETSSHSPLCNDCFMISEKILNLNLSNGSSTSSFNDGCFRCPSKVPILICMFSVRSQLQRIKAGGHRLMAEGHILMPGCVYIWHQTVTSMSVIKYWHGRVTSLRRNFIPPQSQEFPPVHETKTVVNRVVQPQCCVIITPHGRFWVLYYQHLSRNLKTQTTS